MARTGRSSVRRDERPLGDNADYVSLLPSPAVSIAKRTVTSDIRRVVAREAERGVRYGILAVLVVGVRRRDPAAVANAAISFVATYVPGFIERHYDVEFRPWQRVYTLLTMLTHSIGMLGPYDDGAIHVAARRRDQVPHPRILGLVVGAGVLWELMEYAIHAVANRLGLEPLLISYGREDTLFDLLFDLVGALLVVAFGDRLLGNLVDTADDQREA
jgi:hypothetical protein